MPDGKEGHHIWVHIIYLAGFFIGRKNFFAHLMYVNELLRVQSDMAELLRCDLVGNQWGICCDISYMHILLWFVLYISSLNI